MSVTEVKGPLDIFAKKTSKERLKANFIARSKERNTQKKTHNKKKKDARRKLTEDEATRVAQYHYVLWRRYEMTWSAREAALIANFPFYQYVVPRAVYSMIFAIFCILISRCCWPLWPMELSCFRRELTKSVTMCNKYVCS